ncbi:MAG: hypothetical protein ACLPY5_11605 [Candidatus Bathyarchaeia archaeon]
MDDTKKCRECGAELVLDEKITGVNPTVAFDEKLTPKSITQYRCTNLEKCHLAQIAYPQSDE